MCGRIYRHVHELTQKLFTHLWMGAEAILRVAADADDRDFRFRFRSTNRSAYA